MFSLRLKDFCLAWEALAVAGWLAGWLAEGPHLTPVEQKRGGEEGGGGGWADTT